MFGEPIQWPCFSKVLPPNLIAYHSSNGYIFDRRNHEEKALSWPNVDLSPTLDAEVEKLVRLGYDRETAVIMASALIEKEETDQTITIAPSQRLGGVFMGIFLIFFGVPFVLVPTMIWTEFGDSGGLDLLLICVPIPFILAGGFVIFAGGHLLIMALKGKAPAAQSWSDNDGSVALPISGQQPAQNIGAYDSSAFPSMEDIVGKPQEDLAPDVPNDIPTNEAVENEAGSFWGNIDDKGNTE